MSSPDAELDPESADYARQVGMRLRAIRRQKRLSLQEAEELSNQEFKASVLGAYERGERAISVPRLQRLAKVYQVPIDQLLPRDPADVRGDTTGSKQQRVVLDLGRLDKLEGPAAEMLRRFVAMIQLKRQDFNGRVLTIRSDDLHAIACIIDAPTEGVAETLGEMRVLYEPATTS